MPAARPETRRPWRILVLLLLAVPPAAVAQPASDPGLVVLDGPAEPVELAGRLQWLPDAHRALTLAEARLRTDWLDDPTACGLTGSPGCWIRFRVRNLVPEQSAWILEIANPFFDEVTLYPSAGARPARISTVAPVVAGNVRGTWNALAFGIPPGETRTVVLYVDAPQAGSLGLNLWTDTGYSLRQRRQHFGMGVFAGVVLLFALYNSFLAFSLDDHRYLHYVAYITFSFFAVLIHAGLMAPLFGGPQIWSRISGLFVFVAGLVAFGALFSRSFLETATLAPFFRRLLTTVAVLAALCLIPIALGAMDVVDQMVSLTSLLLLAGVFGGGLTCYLRGQRSARFFLVAWMGVGTAMFLISAQTITGIVLVAWRSSSLMSAGVVWEAIFLSIALADRFRGIQTEAIRRRAELEQTYEAAPVGLAVVDAGGRFLVLNRRLKELPVWGEGSAKTGIGDLRDELAVPIRRRLEAVLAGGEAVSDLELAARVDGSADVFLLAGLRPVIGEGGRVGEAVVTVQDISEIRREHETRMTLEARLQHSRRLETIGTMAGGIAHNFNNVLSPILGYTDLVKRQLPPDSPHLEYLDKVLTATYQARDTVRKLLAYSRHVEPVGEPASLRRIVDQTVDLVGPTAPPGVAIRRLGEVDDDLVACHATELCHALVNICGNGLDAMEGRGGELRLVLSADGAPDRIRLSVEDDGAGMEPAVLERVFEPFFTTKGVGKGTGLGLSVAQGVITGYGGEVTVKSEVGRGTAVHIDLPRWHGEDSSTFPVFEAVPMGREKVLFVDDERELGALMKVALPAIGYDVDVRTNASEALAALSDAPEGYDVLITDQVMPGMSGLELIEELRARRSLLPVILLTGDASRIEPRVLQRLAVHQCLAKPVSVDEIGRAVRQVFDAAPAS